MSYIPKYILKRMFPDDCVKKIPEGIQVELTNVISPFSVDEMPPDVENYIEFKVDGKPATIDQKKKLKLILNDKSVFTVENAKTFEGTTVPIGGNVKVIMPSDVKKGEEHEFELTIKTNNPLILNFKRTVK
jgi:hypothetical protein